MNIQDQFRAALLPLITKATQSAVAESTGIAQGNLSAWLNGRRTLPDDAIERLAKHFGRVVDVRLKRDRK